MMPAPGQEKLAIGTAQFGLSYGISNQVGQTSFQDVCDILTLANASQIDTLDTAVAYGNSQHVLGQALTQTGLSFKVVSKLSGKEGPIQETVANSLQNLETRNLYGCLFHDFNAFREFPRKLEELQELQQKGLVNKIGFSLYYPDQAEYLLQQDLHFQLVQVPYSMFDQRFKTVFKTLKKRGVEIHVRSVFLQGLFFLNSGNTPQYFKEILPELTAVKSFAEKHQIPLQHFLLGFAALNPDIDKIVIGVENAGQFRQNLDYKTYLPQIETLYPELEAFALDKAEYLLPFNWKTTT